MNLSDEGALLLMATEHATIDRVTLVKWADEKIADWDPPTEWLIELSTLQSSRLEDYVRCFGTRAATNFVTPSTA